MKQTSATPETTAIQASTPDDITPLWYPWYVVGVLTLANVSSNIDRTILNLLVEPIKRDLHINDTQMSLLMGLSFAMFFATLAIPFGRVADLRSRRAIIGWGIALWSVMTALAGAAKNYWQLFLTRMGVGIGEATLYPAALSLLADYFPKDRLGFALGVYSTGIYLGAGLAVVLGGLIVQLVSIPNQWTLPIVGTIFPWQSVFFIIGLPGLAIALLMRTVREPQRRGAIALRMEHRETPSGVRHSQTMPGIVDVLAYIRAHRRTFFMMCAGYCSFAVFSYSASSWIPSLFIRYYGWQPATFGSIYGLMIMTFGTIGSVSSGWIADRWTRRGVPNAKIRVGIMAAACMIPLAILYPQMPSPELSLLVLLPINVFAGMPYGPAAAAFQEVLPPRMRGLGSALYLFLLNLIGLTCGPTAVALLNDYVFHDPLAVRHSLSLVNSTALCLASFFLWRSLKPFAATARQNDEALLASSSSTNALASR